MLQGKLLKREGAPLSELERQVSKALTDLQVSSEIKHQLAELYIVGVKEIQVGSKAAILIYVPVPLLRSFQKIQVRLVRELEKKFGGKHILFLAKRRILPKPLRGSKRVPLKQKRPISRTKTAVHDAWLNELVFPADVVGRRIRIKFDGSKIHLDKGNQTNVEHRIEAFTTVYKKLTGKDVVFEFPEPLC